MNSIFSSLFGPSNNNFLDPFQTNDSPTNSRILNTNSNNAATSTSTSEKSLPLTEFTDTTISSKSFMSSSPSSSNLPSSKKKISSKSVTFHNKIKVILVPSAAEYHAAGCDLWWNESDYFYMREDFRQEMEMAMKLDPSLKNNVFRTMQKLYQPEPLDAGPENQSTKEVASDSGTTTGSDVTELDANEATSTKKWNDRLNGPRLSLMRPPSPLEGSSSSSNNRSRNFAPLYTAFSPVPSHHHNHFRENIFQPTHPK